ncbi:restriction endonuclease [Streptomyces sp. NPDC002619]|uniref:restriction endonuclease n=1 Tax=Streptomyces sp. NPDC002619 TaxID=3364655 RepID=UPI0036B3163B
MRGFPCFKVHKADVGLVVTTASFTENARRLAEDIGIALCDGRRFVVWTEAGIPPWEEERYQEFLRSPQSFRHIFDHLYEPPEVAVRTHDLRARDTHPRH